MNFNRENKSGEAQRNSIIAQLAMVIKMFHEEVRKKSLQWVCNFFREMESFRARAYCELDFNVLLHVQNNRKIDPLCWPFFVFIFS